VLLVLVRLPLAARSGWLACGTGRRAGPRASGRRCPRWTRARPGPRGAVAGRPRSARAVGDASRRGA